MKWYNIAIEPSIRHIVRKLRDNGINTFCSCGHNRYIQCETYDLTNELSTIYNVMHELEIADFHIMLLYNVIDFHVHQFIEISFPDNNSEYYWTIKNNNKYKPNKEEEQHASNN